MSDKPQRFDFWALVPLVGGILWVQAGGGGFGLLLAAIPGALLTASGLSLLLWPGDVRIARFMALGSIAGVLLGLFFWAFGSGAFLAALLSAASFLVAGRAGLGLQPVEADIPRAPEGPMSWARTAVDEVLLGYFTIASKVPGGDAAEDVLEGLREQRTAVQKASYDTAPGKAHELPEAPEHVIWHKRNIFGVDFRSLHFESEFVANDKLPGGERYMRHDKNRETAAWVLEHEGEQRPWLVCIHGYRMGFPWVDFTLFPPRVLHERFGLNLLMPVLPLHGPRRSGLMSGDGFLDGDLRELLHAECHALWDLRRYMAWLRAHGAERIGVLGFSLGGYNASLLAQYDNALDFVIAGIPVSDLPEVLWPNLPTAHQRYALSRGADQQLLRDVLAPVSPLTRPPLPQKDRRFVFGGLADRVVPPTAVARLAAHWQVEPAWYPGGHVTFRGSGIVTRTLREAMKAAGWPGRE